MVQTLGKSVKNWASNCSLKIWLENSHSKVMCKRQWNSRGTKTGPWIIEAVGVYKIQTGLGPTGPEGCILFWTKTQPAGWRLEDKFWTGFAAGRSSHVQNSDKFDGLVDQQQLVVVPTGQRSRPHTKLATYSLCSSFPGTMIAWFLYSPTQIQYNCFKLQVSRAFRVCLTKFQSTVLGFPQFFPLITSESAGMAVNNLDEDWMSDLNFKFIPSE